MLLFQQEMERKHKRSKLKTLFGAGQIPGVDQIRNIADGIATEGPSGAFDHALTVVQEQEVLEEYQVLNGTIPVALAKLDPQFSLIHASLSQDSQIWVALIISVLLWICKTLDGITASAHQLLQMMKIILLTKSSILELYTPKPPPLKIASPQLLLEGFYD
jgi:hypothetical protein